MRIRLLCFGVLLAATYFARPLSGQTTGKGAPVAIVEGQPILEEDLSPLIEGEIRRIRLEEYQVRRRALDDLINQKLVAAKAKDKGLTSEEFLRQEVDEKVAEPSQLELEAYYSDQRNLSNVPFEQVKSQLVADLKRQRSQRARLDFIVRLRQEAQVDVKLTAPRVQVAPDPLRLQGNPNAPVTIVEFSDFQCPYCQRASATIKELMKKYQGRVRLAYRDFPLTDIHSGAERAAEAARCAAEQGQFWAYHDRLFASPGSVSDKDFSQHANALGLDVAKFDACFREGRFRAQIEQDLKEGMEAGVFATPGFFINGIVLTGAQPLAAFENIIEAELASVKEQGK